MPAFAQRALPELERPFTDFYRAYDAWRASEPAPLPQAVIAIASAPVAPWLRIDPSVFAN